VAKYGLLSSAVSEGYIWLVIIAVLNTLVSAYYYLRLIVNMYMQEEKESPHPVSGVLVLGLIGLLAVIVLTLGITPEILLKITAEAATTVF
jgi:NADH-quinone oxidoreductase subunit N